MRLSRSVRRSELIRAGFFLALAGVLLLLTSTPAVSADHRPSVLLITVDALRADHLGCYGYERPTSPNIDRLVAAGLRFDQARTPEPLTGPAMCSMVTGTTPHFHGATRNGLRMRDGLDSMPIMLARNGWNTAGLVGTWALKNNLTRLGDHFDHYGEILNRKRWFGILNGEATGEDLTDEALEWIGSTRRENPEKPFFVWVHYIEPHAPYRFHGKYAARLDVNNDKLTKIDRYDTEIAAVDASIGRLTDGVRKLVPEDELIIVFTADHGESLGEHNYWGHGRHLYEPCLRIPLAIIWNGRIPAGHTKTQATLLDLAPTLLEFIGIDIPEDLPGISWAQTALGGANVPERTLCYQAHKGAVHGARDNDRARTKGLLEIGVVTGQRKETLRMKEQTRIVFDLEKDPRELQTLAKDNPISEDLLACVADISDGLGNLDRLVSKKLDKETVEQLRALGYLE